MATNTERIDDLSATTNHLTTKIELIARESELSKTQLATLANSLDELKAANAIAITKFALLERELEEQKKTREEWGRRRWALLVPIITAVLGAVLGYLLKR